MISGGQAPALAGRMTGIWHAAKAAPSLIGRKVAQSDTFCRKVCATMAAPKPTMENREIIDLQ